MQSLYQHSVTYMLQSWHSVLPVLHLLHSQKDNSLGRCIRVFLKLIDKAFRNVAIVLSAQNKLNIPYPTDPIFLFFNPIFTRLIYTLYDICIMHIFYVNWIRNLFCISFYSLSRYKFYSLFCLSKPLRNSFIFISLSKWKLVIYTNRCEVYFDWIFSFKIIGLAGKFKLKICK